MRFLIDEDLPRSTGFLLRQYGHDAIDVREIGLKGAKDSEIAAYARKDGLSLLTGDFDFSDIRKFMRKTSKKNKAPTIDEISEMAANGKDVSKYFTNEFKVRQPLGKDKIQRVNVDLNIDMLKELDDLAKELNVSRQAVIKTYLRQALDQHRIARRVTK
ncbi:MAG: DUF5615 family PIN-like protein [Deltaproteobacteria bacterium]|nr:DUF5615 family PIN-like protein [Deltaproteobacteria bacterium]